MIKKNTLTPVVKSKVLTPTSRFAPRRPPQMKKYMKKITAHALRWHQTVALAAKKTKAKPEGTRRWKHFQRRRRVERIRKKEARDLKTVSRFTKLGLQNAKYKLAIRRVSAFAAWVRNANAFLKKKRLKTKARRRTFTGTRYVTKQGPKRRHGRKNINFIAHLRYRIKALRKIKVLRYNRKTQTAFVTKSENPAAYRPRRLRKVKKGSNRRIVKNHQNNIKIGRSRKKSIRTRYHRIQRLTRHYRLSTRARYTPSIQGLWNFFASYKKGVAQQHTTYWRKTMFALLRNWVGKSVKKKDTRSLYITDILRPSFRALRRQRGPEERRVRQAQRRLLRWFSRKSRQRNTPLLWLATRHRHWHHCLEIMRKNTISKKASGATPNDLSVYTRWSLRYFLVTQSLEKLTALKNKKQPKSRLKRQRMLCLCKRWRTLIIMGGMLWRFLSAEFENQETFPVPHTRRGVSSDNSAAQSYLKKRRLFGEAAWKRLAIHCRPTKVYMKRVRFPLLKKFAIKFRSPVVKHKERAPKIPTPWHSVPHKTDTHDKFFKKAQPTPYRRTAVLYTAQPLVVRVFKRAFSTMKNPKGYKGGPNMGARTPVFPNAKVVTSQKPLAAVVKPVPTGPKVKYTKTAKRPTKHPRRQIKLAQRHANLNRLRTRPNSVRTREATFALKAKLKELRIKLIKIAIVRLNPAWKPQRSKHPVPRKRSRDRKNRHPLIQRLLWVKYAQFSKTDRQQSRAFIRTLRGKQSKQPKRGKFSNKVSPKRQVRRRQTSRRLRWLQYICAKRAQTKLPFSLYKVLSLRRAYLRRKLLPKLRKILFTRRTAWATRNVREKKRDLKNKKHVLYKQKGKKHKTKRKRKKEDWDMVRVVEKIEARYSLIETHYRRFRRARARLFRARKELKTILSGKQYNAINAGIAEANWLIGSRAATRKPRPIRLITATKVKPAISPAVIDKVRVVFNAKQWFVERPYFETKCDIILAAKRGLRRKKIAQKWRFRIQRKSIKGITKRNRWQLKFYNRPRTSGRILRRWWKKRFYRAWKRQRRSVGRKGRAWQLNFNRQRAYDNLGIKWKGALHLTEKQKIALYKFRKIRRIVKTKSCKLKQKLRQLHTSVFLSVKKYERISRRHRERWSTRQPQQPREERQLVIRSVHPYRVLTKLYKIRRKRALAQALVFIIHEKMRAIYRKHVELKNRPRTQKSKHYFMRRLKKILPRLRALAGVTGRKNLSTTAEALRSFYEGKESAFFLYPSAGALAPYKHQVAATRRPQKKDTTKQGYAKALFGWAMKFKWMKHIGERVNRERDLTPRNKYLEETKKRKETAGLPAKTLFKNKVRPQGINKNMVRRLRSSQLSTRRKTFRRVLSRVLRKRMLRRQKVSVIRQVTPSIAFLFARRSLSAYDNIRRRHKRRRRRRRVLTNVRNIKQWSSTFRRMNKKLARRRQYFRQFAVTPSRQLRLTVQRAARLLDNKLVIGRLPTSADRLPFRGRLHIQRKRIHIRHEHDLKKQLRRLSARTAGRPSSLIALLTRPRKFTTLQQRRRALDATRSKNFLHNYSQLSRFDTRRQCFRSKYYRSVQAGTQFVKALRRQLRGRKKLQHLKVSRRRQKRIKKTISRWYARRRITQKVISKRFRRHAVRGIYKKYRLIRRRLTNRIRIRRFAHQFLRRRERRLSRGQKRRYRRKVRRTLDKHHWKYLKPWKYQKGYRHTAKRKMKRRRRRAIKRRLLLRVNKTRRLRFKLRKRPRTRRLKHRRRLTRRKVSLRLIQPRRKGANRRRVPARRVLRRRRKFVRFLRRYVRTQLRQSKALPSIDALWRRLKRTASKKLLLSLPFSSLHYKARARLLANPKRKYVSRKLIKKIKGYNIAQFGVRLKMYYARLHAAKAWNLQNKPFLQQTSVSREEALKRGFYRRRWRNRRDVKVRYRVGQLSVFGPRRCRQVFVANYRSNRWWRVAALPLPHYQVQALDRHISQNAGVSNIERPGKVGVRLPVENALTTYSSARSAVLHSKFTKTEETSQRRAMNLGAAAQSKNGADWQYIHSLFSQRGLEGHALKTSPLQIRKFVAAVLDKLSKKAFKTSDVWKTYQKTVSVKAARWLRFHFIQTATRWLKERPVEQALRSLSAAQLTQTFALQSPAGATLDRSPKTALMLKQQIKRNIRAKLFTRTPNWWLEETVARSSKLLRGLRANQHPHKIMKSIYTDAASRNLFKSQRGFGWQEKKLVTLFVQALPRVAQAAFASQSVQTIAPWRLNADDKLCSVLFSDWLCGVEKHIKRARRVRSSQSHTLFSTDTVTQLEADLPRFPGRGRRRHSFDAFLRKTYTKRFAYRLRRRTGRVKRLRAGLSTAVTLWQARFAAKRRIRQVGRKIITSTPVRYLTKRQRELTRRYKLVSKFKQNLNKHPLIRATTLYSKRKFTPARLHLLHKYKKKIIKQARSKTVTSYTGFDLAFLKYALQRRFVSRKIRDLRSVVRERNRAPRRPKRFWRRRRWGRSMRRASQYRSYDLPKVSGYTPRNIPHWVLDEYAVRVSKIWKPAAVKALSTGELFSYPFTIAKFKKKAIRPLSKATLGGRRKVRRWKLYCKIRRAKTARIRRGGVRVSKKLRARRYKRLRRRARRKYKYATKWKRNINARLPGITTVQTLNRIQKIQTRFIRRIAKRIRLPMVLSPLHFKKVSLADFVTEEEKARRRAHLKAFNQRKYRRLTELSESFTTLFSQLVSLIIANKRKRSQLTYAQAAKAVQAVYWSLRIYLRTDESGRKADAKEDYTKRLRKVKREVTADAEARYFNDTSNLRTARYRFQPHIMHKHGPLDRGAFDWLRWFIPVFYRLYKEDPEKYSKLYLNVSKVYRSDLSSKALTKWKTKEVPGPVEDQYTRLTTRHRTDNTPRFENMLMTTRRAPVFGGCGAAATLRVISPVGASVARTQYFTRKFSSYTHLHQSRSNYANSRFTSVHTNFIKRQVATAETALPDRIAARTMAATKNRAVWRARNRQLFDSGVSGFGSIDVRLMRGKSPRNSEYIQRLTQTKKVNNILPAVTTFYSNRNTRKLRGSAVVFRSSRAVTSISVSDAHEGGTVAPAGVIPSLPAVRELIAVRRSATLLQSRKSTAAGALPKHPEQLRLFTAKKRALRRSLRRDMAKYRQAGRLKGTKEAVELSEQVKILKDLVSTTSPKRVLQKLKQLQQLQLRLTRCIAVKDHILHTRASRNPQHKIARITSKRSILHFRKPQKRAVFKYSYRKPAIVSNAINVGHGWTNAVLNQKTGLRIAWKMRKQSWENERALMWGQQELKMREIRENIKSSLAVINKKKEAIHKQWRYPTRPFVANAKFLKISRQQPRKRLFKWNSFALSRKLYSLSPAGAGSHFSRALIRRRADKALSHINFFSRAGYFRYNRKTRAEVTLALDKLSRRATFNSHRPELWETMTKPWMNKYRIMKNWLKHAKYAYKHLMWNYKAIPHTPDALFKLIRIRLRLLEWRESDGLFRRHGFKYAFQFKPHERRNARWLEALMFRRSLYEIQRGEYRRHQFPRDQKHLKWLQRARKTFARKQPANTYIKWKHWPRLRNYIRRLYNSAYKVRNQKVALKRFRKLARRRSATTGLERAMSGFGDRLDINLMLLNIAPTTFWARRMAKLGFFRVNGKPVWNPNFRFSPGDYIEWSLGKIKRFQTFYSTKFRGHTTDRALWDTSIHFPGNFEYYPRLRSARYLRLPSFGDIRETSRINSHTHIHYQHESGLGYR